MVTYNAATFIKNAVESFLYQDYVNKELIVIDGASTDETCSVVGAFNSPEIRLVSEADNGIYDAMNKGLRLASGDIVGFLNSDDCYCTPHALSLIAGALAQSDIVSGNLNFVREHDGSIPVRIWSPERHSKGAYARGFSVPHPTTYVTRRVVDCVGEFSTKYRIAGDYDWFLRALEIEKFHHLIIDADLVNMRLGGESTSGLFSLLKNMRELSLVRQDRLGAGIIDKAIILNLLVKFKQLKFMKLGEGKKLERNI